MWLRNPSLTFTNLAPAQRLKRRETLIDKLVSGRARDASTMQDLGGCRIIFDDISKLQEFRNYLEKETRVKHKLLHPPDKYDYIERPKPTGYRGVHYVYGYTTSVENRRHLQGLKIELQLRTKAQHAWATAVEIADLVSDTRVKFEDGSGSYGTFFRMASELIARKHEGMTSCLPDIETKELMQSFIDLEGEILLLDRLQKLKEQGDTSKIKQHTILAFMDDETVEIFGYTKPDRAVRKEQELLADEKCTNVVYVRAATPSAIRSSYRNYLTNPADFVALIFESIDENML